MANCNSQNGGNIIQHPFPKPPLFVYLLLVLLGVGQLANQQGATAQTRQPQTVVDWVERVNIANDGQQANRDSNYTAISADGNYVAFASMADNLVPHDNNGIVGWDIFVVNLQTHELERVSVSSTGEEGNGMSTWTSISTDGRYILFDSIATNFVVPDINGTGYDVFLHDRLTGVTELVSVSSTGEQGNYSNSFPVMSEDARFVAFDGESSNLVPNDTNNQSDIFVRDRLLGSTERVSVRSDGVEGNRHSSWPDISADGRYVVFHSMASNLVLNDWNGDSDIFLHDRLTHTTELVSISSEGEQGDGFSFSALVSDSGQYVVFASDAMNLVNPGTGDMQVFVRDRWAGTTRLVTVDAGGSLYGGGDSYPRAISPDGRYILFDSRANNLVPRDMNDGGDTFIRDQLTGITTIVSKPTNGEQPNGQSWVADFGVEQGLVVYASSSSNLAEGDTNGVEDIFIAHWQFYHQFLPLMQKTP